MLRQCRAEPGSVIQTYSVETPSAGSWTPGVSACSSVRRTAGKQLGEAGQRLLGPGARGPQENELALSPDQERRLLRSRGPRWPHQPPAAEAALDRVPSELTLQVWSLLFRLEGKVGRRAGYSNHPPAARPGLLPFPFGRPHSFGVTLPPSPSHRMLTPLLRSAPAFGPPLLSARASDVVILHDTSALTVIS